MAGLPDEPGTSTDLEAAALERGLGEPTTATEPGTGGPRPSSSATDDDRTLAGDPAATLVSDDLAGARRPLAERPGTRIGPYRLLQQIGEGGMGVVFLAEQERPVRRKVALKIIKAGMDSDQVVARFEAERQALAMMDHPNIARVLDAGATESGRPYFVMELVRGAPITEFCDDARLTPHQRLELLIPVCQAIQHAHQKGVVHRDVKPSNVLVSVIDGRPVPKVIDFGIARAIDQRLTERTLFTQFGAIVGTLEYMSPEQAEPSGLDVDTRSDLYSLGVLLYELLTGSTPLERQGLRAAGYLEILRRIREEEPPRPSARLSDSRDALPSISAVRGTEPARLARLVRGELDWIVMKSLEKDRSRRYETAAALAADLRRYLEGDPVEAGPPSAAYRLRRYARKHRGLLATAAAFAALLVLGAAASTWQAIRATRAERAALAQRDRAERNLGFARQVVDEMYTQVAEKLEDQKEMDDYQREILEKALKFYEQFALPQSSEPQVRLEAARAGLRLGAIRLRLENSAAALQADGQALQVLNRLASDHPDEAAYRDALAQAHQEIGVILRDEERWTEAERELKEAAALWDALVREKPEFAEYLSRLAVARNRLGKLYLSMFTSRTEQAAEQFRLALNAAERLTKENPEAIAYQERLADIHYEYAKLLMDRDDLAGSEVSRRRAVAILEGLARDHPKMPRHKRLLGRYLAGLGELYTLERRFLHADEVLERSAAILTKLAAGHPLDVEIAGNLAATYLVKMDSLVVRGDVQSALEWAGRAIALMRMVALRDPERRTVSRSKLTMTLASRGETFMRLGRHAEALTDFEEILELTRGIRMGELFRAFHGLTKARLGDLSALQRLGDQVRETLRIGAGFKGLGFGYYMTCYDGACIHAALAKLALEQLERPPAARRRHAQPDIERALELLERARTTGEFRGTVVLDEVRREKLLDPLRTEPRFQLLMMDLAFPDDPFGSR